VGIRVELIARSAVGAWTQLVPLDESSTMEMNDGDQRSTFATNCRPTAHTALSAPPDTCLENAITGCSKDSSVYGLKGTSSQDQLFRLPSTSALWSISVTLLDFHECTGRRRHDVKQPSTKALSSFDFYRAPRFTLCKGVWDLRSRLSSLPSCFVQDYSPVHQHWLLKTPTYSSRQASPHATLETKTALTSP
jgi:hypothetical protein